ncbi:MAG: hypothetical protein ACLQPD_34660 [Desulfomonilaceae bacterium]
MPQMKRINGESRLINPRPEREKEMTEEEYEDHLDCCVAAEAVDEALEKDGMKRTRDFAKELGFDL